MPDPCLCLCTQKSSHLLVLFLGLHERCWALKGKSPNSHLSASPASNNYRSQLLRVTVSLHTRTRDLPFKGPLCSASLLSHENATLWTHGPRCQSSGPRGAPTCFWELLQEGGLGLLRQQHFLLKGGEISRQSNCAQCNMPPDTCPESVHSVPSEQAHRQVGTGEQSSS